MTEFGSHDLEVQARGPRLEGEDPRGNHSHGTDFGSVAMGILVRELLGEGGEDAAFPGADLLREGGGYNGC